MFNQIKKIIEYICKPAEAIFKIIETVANPLTNRSKIRYQAIGKSITTVESVHNLFQSLGHIQGFSKEESQYIIDCYQFEKNLPDLTIAELKFNDKNVILKIKDTLSAAKFDLSLEYFKENSELLNHFSTEDVKKILRMLYEEMFNKEKKLIKREKKNNNKNILQLIKT